jgi:hypothetical protein
MGASVGGKIPLAWSEFFLSSKSITPIAFPLESLSNSFVPNTLAAFLSYGMETFSFSLIFLHSKRPLIICKLVFQSSDFRSWVLIEL